MGSMVRRGHVPRHVFALLNIDYDTKNPLDINHHLKVCAFMWHLCLLTGIFVFPRCRCIFTWSSFLRYHDLSLKNDPDAERRLNPPIIPRELDWKYKMDTEHNVLGYCDKQKYEGHRLIKR